VKLSKATDVREILQRIRERLRGVRPHVVPLAILTLLHFTVMQRNFRGSNGIPLNSIPFDFQDSYARFLIFISDSLRAHAWPTWCPYGHAGSPFLVNPQSQLWNPLTWLFCLTTGYDLLLAQWHELLTILFGSVGLYVLAFSLWRKRSAALLAAIAYNFTAARLCNAEHMDIVAAYSLFPWIFWGIGTLARAKTGAVPLLGALIGLLIVSGYPGVVLLSPLWFGAWATWLLITECSDRPSRTRFASRLGMSVLLAVCVSAGYWLPIAMNLGAFPRGAPLTSDAALREGLAASDLWHLFFGTPVSLIPTGVTTDMSMRGLYFGIVALLLAVHAVVTCRNRTVTVLAVTFFAALLMSMGKGFFARVALHDYLSILNFSRFPAADSRPVSVLAGCLLAAAGMANLVDKPDGRGGFSRILAVGMIVLAVGIGWIGPAMFAGAPSAVFHEKFTSVVLFEIVLVMFSLLAVLRFKTPVALAVSLIAIVAVDSGTQAANQTSLWSVPIGGRTLGFREIRKKTFDVQSALVPRVDANNIAEVQAGDAFLNKKFYLASYTPLVLKAFQSLLANGFRGFLVNGQRVVSFGGEIPTEGGAFQQKASPVKFEIKRYLPDRVDYEVDLPVRTTLVFNEMYFNGWRARIDHGADQRMHEAAGGLRALTVDAGRHSISTRFSPGIFWIGLAVTMLSWLLIAGWLVYGLGAVPNSLRER
jgi:hypothetical protein